MTAMAFPESDHKGGRGKVSEIYDGLDDRERANLRNRLSQARLVLKYAPGLADKAAIGCPFQIGRVKGAHGLRYRIRRNTMKLLAGGR